MLGNGLHDLRRSLACLVEDLELLDWYVREVARARDDSWRAVLCDHLGEVRQAIGQAVDSMRGELGGRRSASSVAWRGSREDGRGRR